MSLPTNDYADNAVDAIVEDLNDRRGIKNEWRLIDDEIQDEIRSEWSLIIRRCASGFRNQRATLQASNVELRSEAERLDWVASELHEKICSMGANYDALKNELEAVEVELYERAEEHHAMADEYKSRAAAFRQYYNDDDASFRIQCQCIGDEMRDELYLNLKQENAKLKNELEAVEERLAALQYSGNLEDE